MSITLQPKIEALVRQKVESGEFASVEAVLEAAVRGLRSPSQKAEPLPPPTSEQRIASLEALFEEVDREPPLRATPLPESAFDRSNLYNDRI